MYDGWGATTGRNFVIILGDKPVVQLAMGN
jgi:hypothetical protein